MEGREPLAGTNRMSCGTVRGAFLPTVLQPNTYYKNKKELQQCNSLSFCGATGNRTRDTRIFSPKIIFLDNFVLFDFLCDNQCFYGSKCSNFILFIFVDFIVFLYICV